jgi:predicted small lipoprotein YifL
MKRTVAALLVFTMLAGCGKKAVLKALPKEEAKQVVEKVEPTPLPQLSRTPELTATPEPKGEGVKLGEKLK